MTSRSLQRLTTRVALLIDELTSIRSYLEAEAKGDIPTCTVPEATALYGFKKSTLYKYIHEGKLSYTRDPFRGYLLNMNQLQQLNDNKKS